MKKFLCVFLLSACATYQEVTPAPERPPPVSSPDACHDSCETRRRLHCPSAEPTPAGASCEAVCQNAESSGYTSINPRCLARITACDQEEACADTQ